jgi:pimeloyl-ACP methyl ester carboxylesterase
MALWQDGDVVIEEGKLHYYRTGVGKPPMILLHGLTDSGLCWTRVAEVLEKDYDVIMLDARGHGQSSDSSPNKFTLKELAIDLIKVIQKLGLKTSIFMGHSMGARIAAYVAASVPPFVGRLILEDPEWNEKLYGSTKEDRALKADVLRSRIRNWKGQNAQQLIAEYRRGQTVNWHKTEYTTWAEAKLQVSPNAAGFVMNDPIPLEDMIPKLACPTLLVTGDVDCGAVIDQETAKKIAELNPKVHVANIPGAGHDIHRDKFEPFMQALKDFLGKA